MSYIDGQDLYKRQKQVEVLIDKNGGCPVTTARKMLEKKDGEKLTQDEIDYLSFLGFPRLALGYANIEITFNEPKTKKEKRAMKEFMKNNRRNF